MKKSICMLVVVFLTMVVMSSVAFAAYEDIQVVSTESDNYAYGTVGAQLYYNSKGVWVKQIKLYNGTPQPGYDNPVWAVAEAMTYENTTEASADVRFPSPHIFAADVTSAPAISYYVFGDAATLAIVKDALSATGLNIYYEDIGCQILVPTLIGTVNTAVIYSVSSGLITYYPVQDQNGKNILNVARLKAFMATDSFRF